MSSFPRHLLRLYATMLFACVSAATLASALTFDTTTVDGGRARVGENASHTIVNGRPAMVYYDATNNDIMYVRASDADGSAWGNPVTLVSNGSRFFSFEIVNGKPAIVWNSQGAKFMRANDADGTSWAAPVVVIASSNLTASTNVALADVNGNPAISYYNVNPHTCFYLRASDPEGTTWGTPANITLSAAPIRLLMLNGRPAVFMKNTVGTTAVRVVRSLDADGTTWPPAASRTIPTPGTGFGTGTANYASVAIINDKPAVSYSSGVSFEPVRYVAAIDVDGTAWGSSVDVATSFAMSIYGNSLALVDGVPAIAFEDSQNTSSTGGNLWSRTLHYIRAQNADGTAWGTNKSVTSGRTTGGGPALSVVNGTPAVGCYDFDAGELRYTRSFDTAGLSWPAPTTVHDGSGKKGNAGQHTSLAVIDGKPAIAYFDVAKADLLYVRANNATGSNWGIAKAVWDRDTVGQYASLAVVNGFPAIGCYRNPPDNRRPFFVRAADAPGTIWQSSYRFQENLMADTGSYLSLLVADGRPIMPHYDSQTKDVLLVRSLNANGTAWEQQTTLHSSGDVGTYTSARMIAGRPALCFMNATAGSLMFMMANDSAGASWSVPVTVDGSVGVGMAASLDEVDGTPAISYFSFTNSSMRYVRATSADGSAWGAPVTFSDPASYTILRVVNGRPVIGYYDFTLRDLKLLLSDDAQGTAWSAPFTIDSAGDVGSYLSMAVAAGELAISYYDATNSSLKFARANGFASIEHWRQGYFGSSLGEGQGADDADPDHDGMSNLMEWSTGHHPLRAGTPSGAVTGQTATSLVFTYQRSTSAVAAGISYAVEWNDFPSSTGWSTAGVVESISSDDGTVQTVNAVVPASSTNRFVRLRVTRS